MKLSDLAKPFHADEVEWRVQQSGMSGPKPWARVLCYVQARAVMNRLDEVCGPENWRVSYTHLESGVMCHLSIRCFGVDMVDPPNWVEKSDGASETQVEAFKGGISSALKRAASVWGIGRYLYKLPTGFAVCSTDTKHYPNYAKIKDGKEFSWKTPELPSWALPDKDVKSPAKAPASDSGPRSKLPLPKRPDVEILSDAQLKKIHILRREIKVSEEAYRSVLLGEYGVESTKDLPKNAASHLIDRLARRRKAQLEGESKGAFGDTDETTRMGKLRESALGFMKGITKMATPPGAKAEALTAADLPVDFAELDVLLAVMTDEKELEQIVIKLEAVVAALAF